MKKKIKKQNITTNIPVSYLDGWNGYLQNLPPNQTFELIIDYPVSTWARYKIRTGKKGMGLGKLLGVIGKSYEKVYAAETKYGVWGHYITDLAIEGIQIDFEKKVIRLDVGS